MDERLSDLVREFSECVNEFESSEIFTGPSLYFHRMTIESRKRCTSFRALKDDLRFFEYLYATLAAWGMHRMGPSKTKLLDFETFRSSICSSWSEIEALKEYRLGQLPDDLELKKVTDSVWSILEKIQISPAAVRIVANSKALHHLLPSLIPPIDRRYTYKIFYNRTYLTIPESEAFKECFPRLNRVAACLDLQAMADKGNEQWSTSATKILDNAIVGFVKRRIGDRKWNALLSQGE